MDEKEKGFRIGNERKGEAFVRAGRSCADGTGRTSWAVVIRGLASSAGSKLSYAGSPGCASQASRWSLRLVRNYEMDAGKTGVLAMRYYSRITTV